MWMLLAVTVLVVAAGMWWHLLRRRGARVLVRMDDCTVEARLMRDGPRRVVVDRARVIGGDQPRPIDGELVIGRDRIVWIQIP